MQTQSLRTTLVFALVATTVWVGISLVWGGASTAEAAIGFPVFFGVIFFTMRMSNRMTAWVLRRWGPKPPERAPKGPAVSERTTERPEHVKRRRGGRRHRANRRRR